MRGKLITWAGIAGLLVFCTFAYERLENSDGARYRAEIKKLEADVASWQDIALGENATITALRSGISALMADVECRIEEQGPAMIEFSELTVGMRLEARDPLGEWFPAEVLEIKHSGDLVLVEVYGAAAWGLRTLDELRRGESDLEAIRCFLADHFKEAEADVEEVQ